MHNRLLSNARAGSARRLRPVAGGLVLALATLSAIAGLQPGRSISAARAADVTVSQDNLRTGWDPNETSITPASVRAFTRRFSFGANGQVYAQPLVIDTLPTPTVIVATENDQIYGVNATTGAQLWHTSLGTPSTITTCGDLTPNIGVTGTPVYDPAVGTHGTVYTFAQTGGRSPIWALYAINPVTGAAAKVQTVRGAPSNDSHVTFNAAQQLERPGLLLMNGWVYAAFGSHCDRKPYVGYVAGVNVTSKRLTLWTDESGVTNNQAGIWQSGGGLLSDGSGRIIVTSGNGISPANGVGTKPPGTLAESVIRLSVNSTTGALSARDFFSPNNAPSLDAADRDFGSGGPVGVPFVVGSYSHTLIQAGKDGRIFVLNRDNLGGRSSTNSGALFTSAVYSGQWGHPAVFADTNPLTAANAAAANDYMFYVGDKDVLRVFKFKVSSGGKPTLSDVANSSLVFGSRSGSPVVTSNGTNATTAVLWEVYSPSSSGLNSILEAYDVSSKALSACSLSHVCTLKPIFSAPIGTSAKFTVAATSGGMVYVGTRGGRLLAYGPPTAATAVVGTATTVGSTAVHTTTTKTVTVTAKNATTVTSVSATTGATNVPTGAIVPPTTNQFAVTQVTETQQSKTVSVIKFPLKLAKGDQLHATVAFTPAVPGGTDGSLVISDSSATDPVVTVPLTGNGIQPGLFAEPSALTFPLAPDQGVIPVPVGTSVPETVVLSNFGKAPFTFSGVRRPSGPFSFTAGGSTPTVGQTIVPGESISVAVSFTPTGAGAATGSFTITGSGGLSTTVNLSGIGVAAVSQVTAPAVGFGTIPVGKTATRYVRVTNTGNTPTLIGGTSKLPAPFNAVLTPQPGLPFNPSYGMLLPVTFTPKKAGSFTARYLMKWTDLNGSHTLDVLLTGTAKQAAK